MAVDQVGHRHVHVVVRHVAANRSRIRSVALDDGRVHRVGSAVGVALAVGRRGCHAIGRHVGDGQGVAVELEVGDEGGVLCHIDLKGVGGGDDGVVQGPVREVVSRVVSGDEAAGGVAFLGSHTGDASSLRRINGGVDVVIDGDVLDAVGPVDGPILNADTIFVEAVVE